MLVSDNQRIYIEWDDGGTPYSPEFVQKPYEDAGELIDDIPDEAARIYILTADREVMEDITEKVAEAWVDEMHESQTLNFSMEKPLYVDNSDYLRDYAHDFKEDY